MRCDRAWLLDGFIDQASLSIARLFMRSHLRTFVECDRTTKNTVKSIAGWFVRYGLVQVVRSPIS
ncbi:MAG: hypothetical protein HC936_00415 [Leptolyngbyaceae cyanobacterium SU_3_3]|nr:hypothetical protein [Leptolyngbyaceae cyanobacterium SU_3_3]